MDVYQGYIKNCRLHLPRGENKNARPEKDMLNGLVGDKEFLVSYFKIDGLDLLIAYSEFSFLRMWDHIIRPDHWNADVEPMRRLLFPFSEWTKLDKTSHISFASNSVMNLYGLVHGDPVRNIEGGVAAAKKWDRLYIFKREDEAKYAPILERLKAEPDISLTPQDVAAVYDAASRQ